jgi:hypothetical protein
MKLRHVALGVGIGLVLVAGVQLYGDTAPGETEPPDVNFSEPPKQIAQDALRNLRRTDHTVRGIRVFDSGEKTFETIKYEASDYEVLRRDDDRVVYQNRDMGWVTERKSGTTSAKDTERRGEGSDDAGSGTDVTVRTVGTSRKPDMALGAFSQANLYDPEQLDSATVTVARENESVLVLEVRRRGSRKPSGGYGGLSPRRVGSGLYVIDKTAGRIDAVVVNEEIAGEEWITHRYEVYNYGSTAVTPPSGVPEFDLQTIWSDLFNGPL